jgi:periplasmic divalent cation tolerance protein
MTVATRAAIFPTLCSTPKPMTAQVIVAFCTCPEEAVAKSISIALVAERLATCVNRIANVRSCYIWDGRLQDENEILLMIKTTAERLAALRARLVELHPYDLPELIATDVVGGNEPYLEWIRRGVHSEGTTQ